MCRERRTRLYTFPGGVFEIEEGPDDEPGVGVYLEHRHSRDNDEFDGLRLVDEGPDPA